MQRTRSSPSARRSPLTRHPLGRGSDGNLWFTEQLGNKIGRITTAGSVTEFSIPTAGSQPTIITAGPDGNLWFAENINQIGRITTAGAITEIAIPTANSLPFGIVGGPAGNVWFTEFSGRKIGRIRVAQLAAIPTLSSQMLVALSILLALVGVLLLGRR